MKWKFALLALVSPLLGAAQDRPPQTVHQQAIAALAPGAPAPAPVQHPLPPVGVSALVRELDDWKRANATVGQYPRGHMDIVKWERAQQAGQAAPAVAPQEPAR